MITEHRFVGLRQWGIMPPDNAICQHPGCGMPKSQHLVMCPSMLTIKGETFPCQYAVPHDGWAHSNKDAQAIWGEGSNG